MEKRFSRFIKRRNRRSELLGTNPEAIASSPSSSSISTPGSPIAKRPSFFVSQSHMHSVFDIAGEPGTGIDSLRSFSYDSCPSGKPPTFIGKAQPGNGPVKLQANRRLSTGELIATTEEGALRDIRDGEYIVGRKHRSASQSQKTQSTISKSQPSPIVPCTSPSLGSPISPTPSSSEAWPKILFPQQSNAVPRCLDDSTSTEVFTPYSDLFRNSPSLGNPSPVEFKFFTSHPSISRDSLPSQRTSTPDNRATLVALRKAEHSRLVKLYGLEAATLNLTKTVSSPPSPSTQKSSTFVLDHTLLPDLENKDDEIKRSSHISGTSDSYDDSLSTSSPKRASYVSSHAGSFSTPHTSITDIDSTTSREDIRSMVEQIRSTYLDAFDAHTSPPRPKSRKKKRNRLRSGSAAIGQSDQNRIKTSLGRQTWHAHAQDYQQELLSKPRINSQPVSGMNRLSPIPASPPRNGGNDTGIKRADSTTLGELMADMTRAHMKSQQSKKLNESIARKSSRPSTPKVRHRNSKESWLDLEPETADDSHPQSAKTQSSTELLSSAAADATSDIVRTTSNSSQSRKNFEKLYQDLFGADIDDLWQTSASTNPKTTSLRLTYSGDLDRHNSQTSTPRKASHIPSIPESPEYTHLADPSCPNGQFI